MKELIGQLRDLLEDEEEFEAELDNGEPKANLEEPDIQNDMHATWEDVIIAIKNKALNLNKAYNETPINEQFERGMIAGQKHGIAWVLRLLNQHSIGEDLGKVATEI